MDNEPISNDYNNRLQDLPIKENCEDDTDPNYMTSVVWEPMEHFIHNPERSLTEYQWTYDELRKVNWSALKIAWQRLFKRWYEQEGEYRVFLGDEGWTTEREEVLDFDTPPEPEAYDSERAKDPKSIKEDYHWLRNELIQKFGQYNKDAFGLPEDLY